MLGRNRPAAIVPGSAACHAWPAGPRPGSPRAHAVARVSARWRVVPARSPRVGRRGGTGRWWQGVAGELAGTTGRALGNKSGGGAHRGGGAMTGRRGGSVRQRTAASSSEGGSAATLASSGSCEGGRERRGGPNREMAVDWRVSQWRGGWQRRWSETCRGGLRWLGRRRGREAARLAVRGGE
jgi:hypothetical protein